MIALTIIVVILTYSQLWDPVNACVKWGCTEDEIAYLEERIQYDGRYLTCSFFPKPGRDCPCWEEEKEGTECWDKRGAYGCQYYCKKRPHDIVDRPDGHQCLDPATARTGGCRGGYCHKFYSWDV
ncbi:uncharacterized protein LOC135373835 isoform X1 [Ornithodoros turicata]|uniref:uncharacterized protein LOC135373835 isoform X1 n=1 Tax=Ornithodoros turicata TaxID=34597 RepID=UPI00313919B1